MTLSDDQLAVFLHHGERSFYGLLGLTEQQLAIARRELESVDPDNASAVSRAQARIAIWKGIKSIPKQLQEYAEKSAPPATSGNK